MAILLPTQQILCRQVTLAQLASGCKPIEEITELEADDWRREIIQYLQDPSRISQDLQYLQDPSRNSQPEAGTACSQCDTERHQRKRQSRNRIFEAPRAPDCCGILQRNCSKPQDLFSQRTPVSQLFII